MVHGERWRACVRLCARKVRTRKMEADDGSDGVHRSCSHVNISDGPARQVHRGSAQLCDHTNAQTTHIPRPLHDHSPHSTPRGPFLHLPQSATPSKNKINEVDKTARKREAREGESGQVGDSATQQCRKTKFLLGQAAAGIRWQMGTSMLLRSRPESGIRYVPRGMHMRDAQPQSASRWVRIAKARAGDLYNHAPGMKAGRWQGRSGSSLPLRATERRMLDSPIAPICVRCFHSWPTCSP